MITQETCDAGVDDAVRVGYSGQPEHPRQLSVSVLAMQ